MPTIMGLEVSPYVAYIILAILAVRLIGSFIESNRKPPSVEIDFEEEKDQKQEFATVAKLHK